MSNLNRIEYDGFSKEYVKQLLQLSVGAKQEEETLEIVSDTSSPLIMTTSLTKDLTPLLCLDINEFIRSVYRELLEREPDIEGFTDYQRLICSGASREAIIFLVSSSHEFAGRFSVVNIEEYKKKYKRYAIKSKIKRLPIIGEYIQLRSLRNVFVEFRMMDANHREIERNLIAELRSKDADQRAREENLLYILKTMDADQQI